MHLVFLTLLAILTGCGIGLYSINQSGGGGGSGTTLTGVLDPDFGVSGIVTSIIGTSGNAARVFNISLDTDGSIYASGSANNGTDFAIARYDQNGTLDTSFGTSGVFTFDSTGAELLRKTFVTSGKLISVGGIINNSNDAAVVHMLKQGSLDTSFDSDGIRPLNLANPQFVSNARQQADGKILFGGTSGSLPNRDAFAGRLLTSGAPDPTFNGGTGSTTTSVGVTDIVEDMILQNDNKIILAGSDDSPPNDFLFVRYNTSGSLDLTFSGDGIATFNIGTRARVYALALQSNGKIIFTGDYDVFVPPVIGRVDTDGTLDSSFNTVGLNTLSGLGTSTVVRAISIASDGGIFAFYQDSSSNCGLAKLSPSDGSIDTSFSEDGMETVTTAANEQCLSIQIQSDGKILGGGLSGNSFILMRFLP